MLREKTVDFFAHQSGLADSFVAEREVVLTYVLKLLSDTNLLDRFAFKGGTCLRKVFLGSSGRFSTDLDFTALSNLNPDDAILDLMEVLNREFHGITFHLDNEFRITQGGLSFAVEPTYNHEWNDSGFFQLQVSLRDLHDLYCFSGRPFSRPLIRTLTVTKLWQVRDPFDPQVLTQRLRNGPYDWTDVNYLLGRNRAPDEHEFISTTIDAYSFLEQLTQHEKDLAEDSTGHRLTSLHKALTDRCRELQANIPLMPADLP